MKNFTRVLVCTVFVLPAIFFSACAGGASARDNAVSFTGIEGKKWVLAELKNAEGTVILDRKKFEADNMGGFFTISFGEGRANGVGAPNRYFGPYTPGDGRTLAISNLASTKMLALKEPGELKEAEFFARLTAVTRWELREGKLELYSSVEGSAETALVFVSRDLPE